MPAAMKAIPAVISGGSSIAQIISGFNQARRLQEEIDNYERQDVVNPYEGIQVSTLGADRQLEEQARAVSTIANNASQGGTTAILAATPTLLAQQNQLNTQITANLDQQEAQRQQMIASGEAQRQSIIENREQNDLMGLGNLYSNALMRRSGGFNNLLQTAMSTAQGMSQFFDKDGKWIGGSIKDVFGKNV